MYKLLFILFIMAKIILKEVAKIVIDVVKSCYCI